MANIVATLRVRLFTLLKVPLVAWLRPVVEELNDEQCTMRIPLGYRSKNHVGSMYVGALCTGAEATVGVLVFDRILKQKLPVVMVARTLDAEFLRRAEGDVSFTCEGGAAMDALMEQAMASGERVEDEVTVEGRTRAAGSEPVARFTCIVSCKRKRH